VHGVSEVNEELLNLWCPNIVYWLSDLPQQWMPQS
jgi:hypothetical protein